MGDIGAVDPATWSSGAGAAVSGAELAAHARTMLAAYKCPEQVFTLTALPRNPLGKLNRAALTRVDGGPIRPCTPTVPMIRTNHPAERTSGMKGTRPGEENGVRRRRLR